MARCGRDRRQRQRGLTLMEVLIAVTLVGLLMVAISVSLSIGLRAMERANSKLELNRRVVRTQQVLEQQIVHLTPTIASCVMRNADLPQQMPFFQGEPLAMRFVSSYSMLEGDRGYPRIIELTAIPGDARKIPPGLRLIVNELPYQARSAPASYVAAWCRTPLPASRCLPSPRWWRALLLLCWRIACYG